MLWQLSVGVLSNPPLEQLDVVSVQGCCVETACRAFCGSSINITPLSGMTPPSSLGYPTMMMYLRRAVSALLYLPVEIPHTTCACRGIQCTQASAAFTLAQSSTEMFSRCTMQHSCWHGINWCHLQHACTPCHTAATMRGITAPVCAYPLTLPTRRAPNVPSLHTFVKLL